MFHHPSINQQLLSISLCWVSDATAVNKSDSKCCPLELAYEYGSHQYMGKIYGIVTNGDTTMEK